MHLLLLMQEHLYAAPESFMTTMLFIPDMCVLITVIYLHFHIMIVSRNVFYLAMTST